MNLEFKKILQNDSEIFHFSFNENEIYIVPEKNDTFTLIEELIRPVRLSFLKNLSACTVITDVLYQRLYSNFKLVRVKLYSETIVLIYQKRFK